MPPTNQFALAFLLILIGLIFYLIVFFAGKASARARGKMQPPAVFGIGDEQGIADHDDAVIVVEGGGRVKSVNQRARQIFHLQDGETPNLERLSRKVRPGEALLGLCAHEGQARFVLDGRLVGATSYLIGENGQSTAVVTLRYPEITGGLAGSQGGFSAQSLQTFTQLTQAMASSLDLDDTIHAVLENIEKLMPADFMEATVWDAESQIFIPYRLAGLPGVDRKLDLAPERYHPDQGFTGWLYRERKPLIVADIETNSDIYTDLDKMPVPLRSYLGIPLLVGSEFIGTLELGSMAVDTFREEDLDLLRLFSGQAAIAIHNALLYRTEQQRTAELTSLAQLAQAFSSVRDPNALFARLVNSIVPLVDVDILGFLVYNEAQRILEARSPFHGLPDPIVELYRVPVPPNSFAERMLLEQDVLITENAFEDEKWALLGMDYLAQAASLRETVLVPLSTGGHILGYLQASNHSAGAGPFTQAELHLLLIVANQTASIIENAGLVQQSRIRAQRAEALRRVSSLASSAASLDEILQYSIQELARMLRASSGAIFLLDQDRGLLSLHRASVFGKPEDLPDRLVQMVVDDPQYPFTATGTQHVQTVGSVTGSSQAIIPFYHAILSRWGLESAVIVPLVAQNEGIGELWFASPGVEFFEQGDAQVAATAAGQLAGAVEQAFLRGQTDDSLRRRVEQLTAINRISRELSTSLDLNHLLNLVYDESLRTTRADCGTILLFDLNLARAEQPSIRFFVGDMPDADLSILEQSVIEQDAPQVVQDFSHSEFQPPHPGIRSALIVPISYQRQIAGMICLHGKTAGQFDQTAVEISQSLAVQAAVALSNALAFEEQNRRGALLKRELETLSRLTQVSRLLKPSQDLNQSLHAIASAILSATPFQAVVISVCDADTQVLERVVGLGLSIDQWNELQAHSQPWNGVQQLLQPDFLVGDAYYIPHTRTPAIPVEVHTISVLPSLDTKSEESWHADDMLLVPLYDSAMNPLGLISVDAPADNRRPDRPSFEALEVFAAQASIIIESHRRAVRLEDRLSESQREKVRLELAAQQAQQNLPLMLHKELEQAMLMRGLNQRIERIRASLQIAAEANRQEGQDAVLRTLGSEMLTRFAMQVALVAERTPAGIRLLEVIGSLPLGANPEALFGQRNPLRQILQRNMSETSLEESLLLVANLDSTPEWQDNPLLNACEARSMLGLLVETGEDSLVGVLVIGQRAMPAFLAEDRDVFAQLSRQVSVGLRNQHLLRETRRGLEEVNLLLDFSRKLGSLSASDILEVLAQSLLQMLPQAHAGWVGMWEEKDLAIEPQVAVGYISPQDVLAIRYGSQSSTSAAADNAVVLPLRVFRGGWPERVAEVDFASQYHLSTDDLLHYRKATGGRLPVSAMLVPLRIGESVLGIVSLENFDTPGAFGEEHEALASSFTRQAALALENARLFAETRHLTEDLERRVEERTVELRREHQKSETLLHIITELSTSLDMSRVLNRTLSVINESIGCEESLIILSREDADPYSAGMALAQVVNNSSSVARQIARWVIRMRRPVLIGRVQDDARWETQTQADEAYQSVMAEPLVMGEDVLGALLLFHRRENFFSQDQMGLMEITARQIGIALNNAELFNLIRDQSEHLGILLREQQIEASRSRAILEAVADGVLVTDANNQITLFNASAGGILSLQPDQVSGKSLENFTGLFNKAAVDWIQTIRGWSQQPAVSQDASTCEWQLDLDNGGVVSVHLAPVFWRQDFLGTVSIFHDVTHAVQVDRLKSEFVANVSHELRTPMTSIKGYVEVMLMGAAGELSPQQAHFLQIVKSNTERLGVLVNDLLDVSRIEAGRVSLDLVPLDIRELASEVISDLQRRSQEENRPMTFTLETQHALPMAFGDLERIRQVISSLVGNSYNYTPENGCVSVSIHETGNEIQVDVRDNGIGIPPDTGQRIFERFFRGEDPLVLATAGTGLGLSIARTLVEMHQGRIWFESSGRRGEGSVFSFTLPVYEKETRG